MRIINGSHRARKIVAPKEIKARPTTDFAKEGLFNILQNRLDFGSLSVLDLFAGTGNISYEFASRGAQEVVAVDIAYQSAKFINKMANELGFDGLSAVKSDCFKYIRSCGRKFDLIFCDPPYEMEGIDTLPGLIHECNLLADNGLLIIEHSEHLKLPIEERFLETRSYGKVNFSFFSS